VVNDDGSRALERAGIIEPQNRHGTARARLRRTTIMTQLLAQPNGRIWKCMPARKGDASRYYMYLKTRRLEERPTWKLALAAMNIRHDTPHPHERRAKYFSEDTHECTQYTHAKRKVQPMTIQNKVKNAKLSIKPSNPIIP
jgi:hypothetical protein